MNRAIDSSQTCVFKCRLLSSFRVVEMINAAHFEVLFGRPARQISCIRPRFRAPYLIFFLFCALTQPCWVIQIASKKKKLRLQTQMKYKRYSNQRGNIVRILNVYVTSFRKCQLRIFSIQWFIKNSRKLCKHFVISNNFFFSLPPTLFCDSNIISNKLVGCTIR